MAKVKNIENVQLVTQALLNSKIKNPYICQGILCVIAKESRFKLKEEKGYSRTSNERILKIFGKRLPRIYHEDEKELNSLKKDPEKFFNLVYGNRGGNTSSGDGYKYRGRGFNQLTFKSNYKIYSTKEFNLVKNPELLNDPKIAAKVVVMFFERYLKKYKKQLEKRLEKNGYNPNSIEGGILIAANINAGIGKLLSGTVVQRAYTNAKKYKDQMVEIYNAEEKYFKKIKG